MTITDSTGISLAAAAILATAIWAVYLRLSSLFTEERLAREAVTADLGAFKLRAVETFATAGAIEKSEERLAVAMDRLTARLETVIGRIEMLSTEMARIAGAKQLSD